MKSTRSYNTLKTRRKTYRKKGQCLKKPNKYIKIKEEKPNEVSRTTVSIHFGFLSADIRNAGYGLFVDEEGICTIHKGRTEEYIANLKNKVY